MHVVGCASIIGFLNQIPYELQLVDDDQDDESFDNLVSKSNKRLQFFREFQIMIFPNSPLIRLGNMGPTLLDIVSKLISGGVVNT